MPLMVTNETALSVCSGKHVVVVAHPTTIASALAARAASGRGSTVSAWQSARVGAVSKICRHKNDAAGKQGASPPHS